MMGLFIIYLFISVGCSSLWSLSEIFIPVRNFVAKYIPNPFKKMLLCMECSSFWIGALVSLTIFPFPIMIYNGFVGKIILSILGGISTHITVKILLNKDILN